MSIAFAVRRQNSGVFCAVLLLISFPANVVRGQVTSNTGQLALYLLSGTPGDGTGGRTPGGPGDRFPVVLYRADSHGKLASLREVVQQQDGSYLAQSAGHIFFFVHPSGRSTSVGIVHTENPMRADDVVFDPRGFPLALTAAAAAEPQGSSINILLPFVTDYGSAAGVRETLAIVPSTPDKAGPRVRFDAWEEYGSLRYEGLAGGPALVDCLGGQSEADNVVVTGDLGRRIVVDELPPALRGANRPETVDIVAASKDYFVTYVYPRFLKPGAPKNPINAKQLFVYDRVHDRWKTIQIEGDGSSSRLFGSWLATLVMIWNSDHKLTPNPASTSGERNVGVSERLPDVRSWYADEAERFYLLPGVLILQNLGDGRKIRIETGQEDSEILWIGQDSVLYRVNDTIFQARIAGDKLQSASVVVKDDDVPEVHWAFWSN
jgi:hypothetical protein